MAVPSERVSTEQLERLIDFLEMNEDLARGHCRSKEGRQRNKKLWEEVTLLLNSLGNGAIKDAASWSKYWSDYKNRLKNKIRSVNAAARQTGGGPITLNFTPLEERCRRILGADVGCSISGVQINPFGSQMSQTQNIIDYTSETQTTENFATNSDMIIVESSVPILTIAEPVSTPTMEQTPPPQMTARTEESVDHSVNRRRVIRRERIRPRLHSLSELRTDIARLEEARVTAETKSAEALATMANALNNLAGAVTELVSLIRTQVTTVSQPH